MAVILKCIHISLRKAPFFVYYGVFCTFSIYSLLFFSNASSICLLSFTNKYVAVVSNIHYVLNSCPIVFIILLYIFLFLFFFNFTITFDLPHQVAIDLQHGCYSVTTLHSTLYRRKKMLKNNAFFNKVIETQ